MSDSSEKTIKVVKFDGTKDEDWRVWNAKSRAIGTMKKWVKSLDKDPPSGFDIDNPKDNEKDLVKAENDAKMYLTLACTDVAFEYIIGKNTAHEMYQSLKERFEAEEVVDYVQLLQNFQDCSMSKETENP